MRRIDLATPVACLGASIGLLVAACGGPMKAKAGDVRSPTGGVAIVFEDREIDEQRFRRFELDADGTLHVGGGRTALRRETDWSCTPSAEELRAILGAAERASLQEADIACDPVPEGDSDPMKTTIEYAWPGGKRRIDLVGTCPAIEPLRAAFEQASLARFKRQLDALPEAGARKR